MQYVEKYGAKLNFGSTQKAVDGPAKKAFLETKKADGTVDAVERAFDMIHVCPAQRAPGFVRESPLADKVG